MVSTLTSFKCWADDTCKKPHKCSEFCPGYVLLKALYLQSNMPPIYQYDFSINVDKRDIEAFKVLKDYRDDVINNVERGRGLYIHGKNTGTGKTSAACKIMNTYFKKMAFRSNLNCLGVFINVPVFLEDIRKSFDGDKEEIESLIDRLMDAPLAIFDDIGAEKPSDWVRERLYTMINERVVKGFANIFTSNMSLKELEEVLGHRISSRIHGTTRQIHLKGADYRKSKEGAVTW